MKSPRVGGRRRGRSRGSGLALAGSVALHGTAVVVLFSAPALRDRMAPPVYRVDLVAAPRVATEQRRAPEAIQRPAERPAPVENQRPRRTSVAPTPPPPTPAPAEKEPAPRTNPVEAAPDVEPSTGSDAHTVKTTGVEFPHPEYLRNIVAQVYRQWQRPPGNVSLRAEVMFFVHRDGTISNFQFVRRSGNFGFDLEAQGAIEAAAPHFGALPEGYAADVLPVSFFFDPSTAR
ncbi:MAG TPA: energy transducer TonB [Gemmatimonadales bacterium]